MDREKVLTYVLLGALIACIGGVVYIIVTPQEGEHFTEFYILGPGGKAADYPTELVEGENGEVIMGVVNHEWEAENYTAALKLDNQVLRTIDGIRLEHGENWIEPVTFTPEGTGENMKLQFLLYKDNLENAYRDLHLWVSVEGLG